MSYIAKGQLPPGVVDRKERPVSMDELQKHDKETDLWMAINGTVYDCTGYLDAHPGGKKQLLRGGGKDATELFLKFHPWVSLQSIMAPCVVGPLISDDTNDYQITIRSELESPLTAFQDITFRIQEAVVRGASRVLKLVPEQEIHFSIISGLLGIVYMLEKLDASEATAASHLPIIASLVSWDESLQVLTLLEDNYVSNRLFGNPLDAGQDLEGENRTACFEQHPETFVRVRLVGPVPRKKKSVPLQEKGISGSLSSESYGPLSQLLQYGYIGLVPFSRFLLTQGNPNAFGDRSSIITFVSTPDGFVRVSSFPQNSLIERLAKDSTRPSGQSKKPEDLTVLDMHGMYVRQKSGGLILFSKHNSFLSCLPLFSWVRNWSLATSPDRAPRSQTFEELNGNIQITCIVDMTAYSLQEIVDCFLSQSNASECTLSNVEVHYIFKEEMKSELNGLISQRLRSAAANFPDLSANCVVGSSVPDNAALMDDFIGLDCPPNELQVSDIFAELTMDQILRRSVFHPQLNVPCYYSFLSQLSGAPNSMVRTLLVRGILPQPHETQCVVIHAGIDKVRYDISESLLSSTEAQERESSMEWNESIRDQCLNNYYLGTNVIVY